MKNLKTFVNLFVLLFCTSVLFAQKQNLEIDKLMTDRSLSPEQISNLQWYGNQNAVVIVEDNVLKKIDFVKGQTDIILRLADLNREMINCNQETLLRFPNFHIDDDKMYFFAKNCYLQYDFKNEKLSVLTSIPEEAKNLDVSPDRQNIAYTQGNVLMALYKNIKLKVSQQVIDGVVDGQSVHRNEFGINKGTFFSPDSKRLAYYSMDERMVSMYPLVNTDTRVASLKSIRYPMAGMLSHHVSVGIYDFEHFSVDFLRVGMDKEAYRTNIVWNPDSKSIYVAIVTRDQKTMTLREYNAETGAHIKTLFDERSKRYVEPQHPMVFLPKNPKQFLWMSERDGYNHLYLYDTEGRLIRQVTSGEWVVKSIVGFSPKGDKVYFTANKDSHIETQLYAAPISKSGKIERLTSEPGVHRITQSPNGNYFIDQYSNLETPNVVQIIDSKGKVVKSLLKAENPLANYNIGQTEIGTIKTADGMTDLYYRLIKPYNFDPSKKYPVFVYVYGGPHSQLVTNSWLGGGNTFFHYLSQEGFIVFTLDNRGTSNRGFDFESCTHRQLGTVEVADQMRGVEFLRNLPYVDADRMSVDGWSYGGFMAISLMLKQPGVFNIASAGGPVIDWKWYEVMYTERYMETPIENPVGYEISSLLNYINNLEGKLLIIQGMQDETVVPQQSTSFIKECIKQNKQVDYFIYPNHEHNVRGVQRGHLYRKIFDYHKPNLRNSRFDD